MNDDIPSKKKDDFLIVGIGASAGGIKTLKEFFEEVPADSEMAYVVILHLSPQHESQLAEILQTTAKIPVRQINEKRIKVEPNAVYVIAPNKSLTMRDGYLALEEIERVEERRSPVDVFFRTLAESHGARAVSVILSGTGANGSSGVRRVKEMGGIIAVQDPREAEYNDMPRNSLATGLVDYVLPVREIPARIIAYRDNRGTVEIPVETGSRRADDDNALREIIAHLRVRTGHDFTNYKRASILRRIERRINVHELKTLPEYSKFLREHPEETASLLKDLLISVTNFFRDKEAFEKLESEIIPRLFAGKKSTDLIRVWVAGCATGEEAYSLAILIAEYAANQLDQPKIQIFATDIDESSIAQARDGFYNETETADVSDERLRRFFNRETNGFRIRRELREVVLFAVHNLLKDAPFSRLDLVSCRNLLIYFDQTAQDRVMETLHFALEPNAFLFLGSSESVERHLDLFVPSDKENRIFQSRPVVSRLPYPVPDVSTATRIETTLAQNLRAEIRAPERLPYLDLHRQLLEEYAPPSVVVNHEYEILHLSASVGKYFQISGGEPSFNLLKIIRPELRLELRTALYQAVQRGVNVEAKSVSVSVNSHTETIDIQVRPVFQAGNASRGFVLVVFKSADKTDKTNGAPTVVTASEPVAQRLEDELIHLKSQLRVTIEQYEVQQEEYKASNEELQAINEELRSAAEELELSKEELQSLNEELMTVNEELKIKIEELSQANADFQNLMNSTDIGTIFLDRAFHVKMFTPSVRRLFNLIPADLGRSLADINTSLEAGNLLADVELVHDKLQTVEREVRTGGGDIFLMRLSPYRTAEDRINGIVISFIDITERKRAEEALRDSEERYRTMVKQAMAGVAGGDLTGKITLVNQNFCDMSGYAEAELIGKDMSDLIHPEDRAENRHFWENLLKNGTPYQIEARLIRKDGKSNWVLKNVTTVRDQYNQPESILAVVVNINERKEAERKLRESEESLRHSREDLERRVAERTSELAEANQELQTESEERRRTEDERERLLRQIITTQEDERRRIALDLHDQLGQQLTALRLKLESLRTMCADDERLCEKVVETQEIAKQVDADVGFLAWELRPTALNDLGLKNALDNYVKQWSNHYDIRAEFHAGDFKKRLADESETNLYRIAQEALNNISKHAEASFVSVLLEQPDDHAVLIIEDDGKGFETGGEAEKLQRGLGLIGMRERAALIGGSLEIESSSAVGTTIYVRVPVDQIAGKSVKETG